MQAVKAPFGSESSDREGWPGDFRGSSMEDWAYNGMALRYCIVLFIERRGWPLTKETKDTGRSERWNNERWWHGARFAALGLETAATCQQEAVT